MSRARLVEMARINVAHSVAGTNQLADGISSIPAANYVSPERWEREVEQIFKRLPLLLATSAELPTPNSYKAMEVVGVPVLISRGDDGVVRAFVNMCSHRGAMIVDTEAPAVPRPVTTTRRFTCPYHGWTYDTGGDLVGVFKQTDFGLTDLSCHGLTALPASERAGMIWVSLRPDAPVDAGTYLCGMDELMEHARFAGMRHVGNVQLNSPNWKVALDGYVDLYHLPVLHKNTFGTAISPDAVFHPVGPHQRITGPSHSWKALADVEESDWPIEQLTSGLWSVFPHCSIAGFAVGEHKMFQVARLFPGASVEQSVTHLDFLITGDPDDATMELARKQMDFLIGVVRDEDYATGMKLQRALKTGAKKELIFGRNEGGARHLHGWIDRIVAASDAELPALFSRAGSHSDDASPP